MNEVFRQEKKYWITRLDMERLSRRLEPVMLQDPHNGALGYTIRSLYFDTLDERDYTEKLDGVALRRKIRLRIYDPAAEFAMLEMKQKEGAFQKKRSLRIARDDALAVAAGRYESLLGYDDPFAAECYGLMRMRCYRPKTVVEYRRRAFIARENQIRITFDHDIRATEACLDVFSPGLNLYPVLDPYNAVLEVKFNGFLLSHLKSAISAADRSELTVSKYCLARSAGLKFSL